MAPVNLNHHLHMYLALLLLLPLNSTYLSSLDNDNPVPCQPWKNGGLKGSFSPSISTTELHPDSPKILRGEQSSNPMKPDFLIDRYS